MPLDWFCYTSNPSRLRLILVWQRIIGHNCMMDRPGVQTTQIGCALSSDICLNTERNGAIEGQSITGSQKGWQVTILDQSEPPWFAPYTFGVFTLKLWLTKQSLCCKSEEYFNYLITAAQKLGELLLSPRVKATDISKIKVQYIWHLDKNTVLFNRH